MRIFVKKIVAVGSVLIYSATQVAFGALAESNFWAERREQHKTQLLAALPALENNPAPFLLNRLPAADFHALTSDSQFIEKNKILLNALSYSVGTIRKINFPEGKSPSRVVIHIQDVHRNIQAQENIAAAVQGLINAKVDLIGLEGAFDKINIAPLRSLAFPRAIKKVADFYLNHFGISGPIYSALTQSGSIPTIVGVDDPAHYEANVEAFRRSSAQLEKNRELIVAERQKLAFKKNQIFNPALKVFDRAVQNYVAGTLPLSGYVEILAKENSATSQSSLDIFIRCLRMEKKLDFKRVEQQRAVLVQTLVAKVSTGDMNNLLNTSAAYRTGQMGYAPFYVYLTELCKKTGINLSSYPALDEYIRYVLLSDKINGDELFSQLDAREHDLYESLIQNKNERALIVDSKCLNLADKLNDFSLTPEEWKEYQRLSPEISKSIPFDTRPLADFYKEAEYRDKAMAKNLLSEMDKNGARTAVLVTGGFHSTGIAPQLTKAGVAVIEFTPKIEQLDTPQGAAYLSVFTQDKSPLNKLFDREKLFLSERVLPSSIQGGLALGIEGISRGDEQNSVNIKTETNRVLDELGITGVAVLKVDVADHGNGERVTSLTLSDRDGRPCRFDITEVGDAITNITVDGLDATAPHRYLSVYGRWVSGLRNSQWLARLNSFLLEVLVVCLEAPFLWSARRWQPQHHLWFVNSLHDNQTIEQFALRMAGSLHVVGGQIQHLRWNLNPVVRAREAKLSIPQGTFESRASAIRNPIKATDVATKGRALLDLYYENLQTHKPLTSEEDIDFIIAYLRSIPPMLDPQYVLDRDSSPEQTFLQFCSVLAGKKIDHFSTDNEPLFGAEEMIQESKMLSDRTYVFKAIDDFSGRLDGLQQSKIFPLESLNESPGASRKIKETSRTVAQSEKEIMRSRELAILRILFEGKKKWSDFGNDDAFLALDSKYSDFPGKYSPEEQIFLIRIGWDLTKQPIEDFRTLTEMKGEDFRQPRDPKMGDAKLSLIKEFLHQLKADEPLLTQYLDSNLNGYFPSFPRLDFRFSQATKEEHYLLALLLLPESWMYGEKAKDGGWMTQQAALRFHELQMLASAHYEKISAKSETIETAPVVPAAIEVNVHQNTPFVITFEKGFRILAHPLPGSQTWRLGFEPAHDEKYRPLLLERGVEFAVKIPGRNSGKLLSIQINEDGLIRIHGLSPEDHLEFAHSTWAHSDYTGLVLPSTNSPAPQRIVNFPHPTMMEVAVEVSADQLATYNQLLEAAGSFVMTDENIAPIDIPVFVGAFGPHFGIRWDQAIACDFSKTNLRFNFRVSQSEIQKSWVCHLPIWPPKWGNGFGAF